MSHLARFAERNQWPAPAKLNLCLYVVAKRADGYHQLETLFQLLDHGDQLQFDLNNTGRIERSYEFGFSEDVDLCLRAAKLLQRRAGTNQGVTIGMQKYLPMGGGLGGGSSDAATVLIALNHLWQAELSTDELAEIALQLGADVPLFVRGASAWGSGIGELLEPASLGPQKWLVVTPNVPVSTAQIFSHNRLTPSPQMKKIRALKTALKQNQFDYAIAENQLEPIVRAEYPEVEAVFEWFDTRDSAHFSGPARLTGSGGTVFAPVTGDAAQGLLAELPSESRGFIATGLDFHPLYRH